MAVVNGMTLFETLGARAAVPLDQEVVSLAETPSSAVKPRAFADAWM
jgi:hypothetical protein